MPKAKQKNQSKGKSDTKMAARSTPPKHTVTPPARGQRHARTYRQRGVSS